MSSDAMIRAAIEHARANRESYLEGFKELLRIPSISTDPAYRADVERAARWVAAEMERIGLHNCQVLPSAGHPVVFGEWLQAGDDRPTVLIYAHYDVQPVDPLDLWESPPFEPQIRDGKLFARGVIDDKCGVWITLKVLESILRTAGRLPVNIKLFFEGEEEMGSPSMAAFVEQHKHLLAADLLVVSDGGSEPDRPLNMSALRGIVAAEVIVTGPSHDLHSGQFGGIVHNPAHLVGKIIGALHDDAGHVQIPGFYDDVVPLSPLEREQLDAQQAEVEPLMREQAGVDTFWGPSEWTLLERATAQPTCDVNGIFGGYDGPGTKTIIPARAGFKATMRLVANQDPHTIARQFESFVRGFATDTLKLEVKVLGEGWPVQLLVEGPAIDALNRAYESVWGKPAKFYRQGGSVPITGFFRAALNTPMTSLGYGTGYNEHAPNEYLILEYFDRGIDTAIHFLYYLADMADGKRVA